MRRKRKYWLRPILSRSPLSCVSQIVPRFSLFFPRQESENSGSWPPLMGKGVKADKNYYVSFLQPRSGSHGQGFAWEKLKILRKGKKSAPFRNRFMRIWLSVGGTKKMTFLNLYDSGYSSVSCSQRILFNIHRRLIRSWYNKYFQVFYECTKCIPTKTYNFRIPPNTSIHRPEIKL